jgi:hypothetical protein
MEEPTEMSRSNPEMLLQFFDATRIECTVHDETKRAPNRRRRRVCRRIGRQHCILY